MPTCKTKYRVLMFSPAFAPFANAEAIVNSKLALAMLEAGWEVDIISRNLVGMSSYDYGSGWVDPWIPLRAHTHEIRYELGSKTLRAFDMVTSALVVGYPIHGCRWAKKAYEIAMSLHRQRPYDVILSRALPEAAHLPAMKMVLKTGIPWIANWNDPWDFLRKHYFTGSLRKNIGFINAFFSRQAARRATWCTFSSERMMNNMAPFLDPRFLQKSSAIPHVALKIDTESVKIKHDKFQICYTGRIWAEYQDINVFLEGFADFVLKNKLENKASFVFVGIDEVDVMRQSDKYGLSGHVKNLGKLAYLDALHAMEESDVLLAIDPKEADGMILTSKLVDYIQTGRPILAMTTKDSATERLVKVHGAGICVDCEKANEVFKALTTLYKSCQEGMLDSIYSSHKAFHVLAPKTIVDAYRKIFHRINITARRN